MMDKMTDEQRLFHLNLNPHGRWNQERPDWASMTRAKRVLEHHRMHMEMRAQAGPNGDLITHDHVENSY